MELATSRFFGTTKDTKKKENSNTEPQETQ